MHLLLGGATHAQLVTGVAVVVNDSVITLGEIESLVAPTAQSFYNTHRNDPKAYEVELRTLHYNAVEQMVQRKLILHEFLSGGYLTNLLESYVDDRIRDYIQRFYYGDRAILLRSLRAKEQTYESFRREQREDFIVELMKSQNSSNPRKILISPLKVEQYFQAHQDEFKMEDQIKLRMIVLPKSSDSDTYSAKKMGEEILAKIDAGVPFAEMAAVNSSGAESAKGGDRGWVDRSFGFKPELAKVAFGLKPGEHSGVIELPEACYLMMVDDVKPAHIKPLAEVRGDIERTLRNDENIRLQKLWIDRLKRKAFISTF
jgi:parvulin-like peptidyl-prolyl isomerase